MKKKNIILIYADDLGMGLLSCYGQKYYETKNIQRIVDNGMLFNNFYATAFCAPARASLICGMHDAHEGTWTYTTGGCYKKLSNDEVSFDEIQEILQNTGIDHNGDYIAQVAKRAGYVTAEIGKLEWGFSTCASDMVKHGWDYHYGYYDHVRCHGYYPPFLFENGKKVDIEGNTYVNCGKRTIANDITDVDMTGRQVYSQDLFDEKIINFLRENKDNPFFLYHPSQLPHGPIFYPDIDPQVKDNDELTIPEKEFASMVIRLDQTVGKILDEVESLGLLNDTIILFSSDNGHTIHYEAKDRASKTTMLDGTETNDIDKPYRTETCGDIFNGNAGLAGLKFSNWNGGCSIPFVAMCPGLIPKASTSDVLISHYDTLSTIADIVGVDVEKPTDGVSYLPMLKGEREVKCHDYIVYACKNGPALMTQDGWKLRVSINRDLIDSKPKSISIFDEGVTIQLYNWKNDIAERNEISHLHEELTNKLAKILEKECSYNILNGTPEAHKVSVPYSG